MPGIDDITTWFNAFPSARLIYPIFAFDSIRSDLLSPGGKKFRRVRKQIYHRSPGFFRGIDGLQVWKLSKCIDVVGTVVRLFSPINLFRLVFTRVFFWIFLWLRLVWINVPHQKERRGDLAFVNSLGSNEIIFELVMIIYPIRWTRMERCENERLVYIVLQNMNFENLG